jgi:hypothetical protein
MYNKIIGTENAKFMLELIEINDVVAIKGVILGYKQYNYIIFLGGSF